jgi:hypothetical protein
VAIAVGAVLIASVGGIYLIGGGGGTGPSPTSTPTPPPSASPTPAIVDTGTVTLTDNGCTWDGNPAARLRYSTDIPVITIRNETDHFGDFRLERLIDGHEYQEGIHWIAAAQRTLGTGADWPPVEFSELYAEAVAEAGMETELRFAPTDGLFGVVCSANTSSTGDALSLFLAGPMRIDGSLIQTSHHDAGTIVLTADGCEWDHPHGSGLTVPSQSIGDPPFILTIDVRNETATFGNFGLYRLDDDRTWEEAAAWVVAENDALRTGADHEPADFAVEYATVDSPAGLNSGLAWVNQGVLPGTYGVVCSANEPPPGAVFNVYLVGPLGIRGIG